MLRKLLLVGGGHAHLHILKQLQRATIPNVEVTLLSPSRYQYYSGLVSGYVQELYTLDQIRMDLRKLAELASVTFVEGRALFVDPIQQFVTTDSSQASIAYDVVSFDIGSQTGGTHVPGVMSYGTQVKPIESFIPYIDQFDEAARTVVVGGGATGVEMSMAIQARKRNYQAAEAEPVTLVSAGALMARPKSSHSQKINRILSSKGIRLYLNDGAQHVDEHHVHLASGVKLPYDQLLWLTGPKAPDLFKQSGVKVRDQGYLLVAPTLQAIDYPNMFGVGDCIAIDGYPPIPKAGVYAVREAPFLWKNLLGFFNGTPLLPYRPQAHFLSLLSTGDDEALFMYRSLILHGKWCWRLKQWIDLRFVRQYH